ncbi:hypothetical protein [Phytohabitans kaempferiae]|uniref:Type VII secretion protein EccE n=1 Tax=Phytohabitans kaempferiae TaxID=1620943 RepID=A0ABV6M6B6_9ACTN
MNIPISFPIVPAGWLPVLQDPGCPQQPGDTEPSPAARAVCGVGDVGSWATGLPARLWHQAVTGWPWLLAAAVLVLALALAMRVAHRAAWRRAVAGGYWVRVLPPRLVDPGHAEDGWRLLAGLARLTRKGWWRPAKPPLAFEVYQHEGRLTAGLWLPAWVPLAAVTDEVVRVWPGAVLDRTDPPTLTTPNHDNRDGDGGWPVAGVRLHADRSDTGYLVDEVRLTGTSARGAFGGDRLQAVFDALGKPDGPALLQVLVRPAPGARMTALDRASRYPAKRRTRPTVVVLDGVTAVLLGAVRLLLDMITELVSTGRPSRTHSRANGLRHGGDQSRRADPVESKAMREAAEKLANGPHVIATVRVGAARPGGGFARAAARSIGYGFRTAARHLFSVRMPFAATLLDQRRAHQGEWLLLSTAELAVFAHLPADPARYGFEVTALHRPWPGGVSRADPEPPTRRGTGWTRTGWTTPADPAAVGDDGNRERDDDRDDDQDEDDEPPLEAA